jgi:hypothetical protein
MDEHLSRQGGAKAVYAEFALRIAANRSAACLERAEALQASHLVS